MEENYEQGILGAFGDLFLKSPGVQRIFRKHLDHNIKVLLRNANLYFKLFTWRERIFIATQDTEKGIEVVRKVFGIAWVADSYFFPKGELKSITNFIKRNYQEWIEQNQTFALAVRVSGKDISRDEVINKLAPQIKRKVNLSNPDVTIYVEVRNPGWFIYRKKIQAVGGLPGGSSGKVLTMMSGGIDSPVAAFLAAKRGAETVWLHFHSFPLVSNKSIEKVKDLARIFLSYQHRIKVYFIPFQKAQMDIKLKTPDKYRILLYRRLMFKIAERIASREGCQALVTGESLGQVSSQTLPNMAIIQEGIAVPILRPLVGYDKQEIIRMADTMGTLEVSLRPHEDCCTLFTPQHATAAGNIEKIRKAEAEIRETEYLIKETINGMEIAFFPERG